MIEQSSAQYRLQAEDAKRRNDFEYAFVLLDMADSIDRNLSN